MRGPHQFGQRGGLGHHFPRADSLGHHFLLDRLGHHFLLDRLGEDFLLAAWRTLEFLIAKDLDPALIFLVEEALAFDVLAVFKLKFLALVLAAALPEVFLTEFAIFLKYV